MTDHENEELPQGTLADAIAQHLDLKREHGAGDDEVAAERDAALGPARREAGGAALPAEPIAANSPVAPAPEPIIEEPASAPAAAPPPEAAQAQVDEDDSVEFDFGAPVDDVPSGDFLVADNGPISDTDPASEPASTEPNEAAPTPHVFDETPEYDRLWFEEKSPRDFNF
ncbi:MAG: hypothetical protein JHC87_05110 [Thermoleophilaceae bacterium]|nr:hypothetical protein [Thermoleophilaceae bacterium]